MLTWQVSGMLFWHSIAKSSGRQETRNQPVKYVERALPEDSLADDEDECFARCWPTDLLQALCNQIPELNLAVSDRREEVIAVCYEAAENHPEVFNICFSARTDMYRECCGLRDHARAPAVTCEEECWAGAPRDVIEHC